MRTLSRRLGVLHLHLDPAAGEANAASCCGMSQAALRPCRAVPPPAPPVLVGGMLLDLQAHPSGPADVQRGGSVPGRITQSPGGVARNVAEALALLLTSAGAAPQLLPLLVSVVGQDAAGRTLLQHCEALGLSTACISQLPGGATPTVAVVFDLGGEVAACVADVALLEARLLPPLLRRPDVAVALAAAPVAMLDGNLNEAALEEACRQAAAAGVPVWFEPVSAPKSVRATRLLSLLAYVSPNERELAAMAAAVRRQRLGEAAAECCSTCMAQQAAASMAAAGAAAAAADAVEAMLRGMLRDVAELLRAGVRHVVLTLGADGAALCSLAPGRHDVTGKRGLDFCHVPALPARVVNCSGAGDCMVAGCLFALVQGRSAEEALAHGVATAHVAVQSQAKVPTGLDAATVALGAAAAAAKRRLLRFELAES